VVTCLVDNASSQFLFDGLQLRPHAVTLGFPFDSEFASARLAADEGEAQEVEGLRLAELAPLATFRTNRSRIASRKRGISAGRYRCLRDDWGSSSPFTGRRPTPTRLKILSPLGISARAARSAM
jgi:hypothetical protein